MNSTIKLPIELTEAEIEHDLWELGHSPFLPALKAALKAVLEDVEIRDEERRTQGIGTSIYDMIKASV